MNREHVVHSASKALLRASNALEDLQGYLHQIAGGLPPGLVDTSRKIGTARDLVREIDMELNGSLHGPAHDIENQGGRRANALDAAGM
ncbi:MAG: hypothetical protein ACRENP_05965 [Longimicrobiales bacterium]